jgi:purine-binding chemotaxis protein CheW
MAVAAQEFLLFEAGGRSFGFRIDIVEQVVTAVRPMTLPHAPAAIEGIFNLHGTAVPVVDLNAWFGDPPRDVRLDDLFVVLRIPGRAIALHVERANGVSTIADAAIQSADNAMVGAARFLGVAMSDNGIVFLPDIEAFVAAIQSLESFDEATAA